MPYGTFEQLAEKLAKEGFFVHLSRRKHDWHCDLFNSSLPRVPQGNGSTAMEAVERAMADRDSMRIK